MNEASITKAQVKKIHTMLSKLGISNYAKLEMVSVLTEGRTTTTKELTLKEANFLISFLEKKSDPRKAEHEEKCRKEVASIYKLSYLTGMCYGDTPEDKLMNIAKLNKFCRERGAVKKNISEMNLNELRKTRRQFEAILDKNTTKAVNKLINNTFKKKEVINE